MLFLMDVPNTKYLYLKRVFCGQWLQTTINVVLESRSNLNWKKLYILIEIEGIVTYPSALRINIRYSICSSVVLFTDGANFLENELATLLKGDS